MRIGLGTYALFWEWHEPNPNPMSIEAMVERAAELDCDVFQICDDPRIDDYTPHQLERLRDTATGLGVRLELGTRGIDPTHLQDYLDKAARLGAETLRTMVPATAATQGLGFVADQLSSILPRLTSSGISLALETYEQVPTTDLVQICRTLDSPFVGICLDPANCVSALEHPAQVIDLAAPYTTNLHVKDFAFTRAPGWVGFIYAGAELGTGLLDLDHELESVYSQGREPSAIVEHWVPWAENLETTVARERQWSRTSLEVLQQWRAAHP